MIDTEDVKEIVNKILEGSPLFLVDLVIHPGNRIQVFIDGDHDVSISDCRELSIQVESALNSEALDFELMVSSSGIDRPLKFSRQFRKNTGRMLAVVAQSGEVIHGKLVRADENEIEIEHIVKNPKKEKIIYSISL